MFRPVEKKLSILEIAQQALNKVRATIQYSNTYPPIEEHHVLQEQDAKLDMMRSIQIPHPECSLEWIQEIARLANDYQVGNCCEKSCLAFIYLIENTMLSETCIELFNNPFLDHFFVVLNRDLDTDESDPFQWNKNTIICDPWADQYCYELKDNPTSYMMSLVLTADDSPRLYCTVFVEEGESRDARMQACFVLRTRWHQGTCVSFNSHVPICYEAWDLEETSDHLIRESSLMNHNC